MNDPLDQKLEAAVLDLQNRLETTGVNTLSNFTPPKSYKPDNPKVTRQDVKSIFTGQGMPPMDDDDTQIQEDDPRVKFGASFPSNLTLIQPGTVGQEDLGNVPPTPAPAPECPTIGSVTLVLSGIVSCGCSTDLIVTLSIDGTYTLPWDGSQFSLSGQGSWSNQGYVFPDVGSCVTPIGDPETGDFYLQASCSDGLWSVLVAQTDSSGLQVFQSASSVAGGSSVGNSFVCSGVSGPPVGGGTATVSV